MAPKVEDLVDFIKLEELEKILEKYTLAVKFEDQYVYTNRVLPEPKINQQSKVSELLPFKSDYNKSKGERIIESKFSISSQEICRASV